MRNMYISSKSISKKMHNVLTAVSRKMYNALAVLYVKALRRIKNLIMARYYYASKIKDFLRSNTVLQTLCQGSEFDINLAQRDAWQTEIAILKDLLRSYKHGQVIMEYDIPRLGKRADVILLLDRVVFVIEFKVGLDVFLRPDIEQVWDYALDLKNFQEASHDRTIVPILVATEARSASIAWRKSVYDDVYEPFCTNAALLPDLIKNILADSKSGADLIDLDDAKWSVSRYSPTPTIIQAASYMYTHHSVENITRTESTGEMLKNTTDTIIKIINKTREHGEKAICFVTGVPGAGKTLVGLNVAIQQFAKTESGDSEMAVYLSGNGPLVDVLTESLARDKKAQSTARGEKCNITDARREVKSFIQIIE